MTEWPVHALSLTQYYINIQGNTVIQAFTTASVPTVWNQAQAPRCTLPLLVLLPQTTDFVSG
jgi:hypothetical protein